MLREKIVNDVFLVARHVSRANMNPAIMRNYRNIDDMPH